MSDHLIITEAPELNGVEQSKAEAGDLEKLYTLLNDLQNIEFPNVDSASAKDVCAGVISSVATSCQEIQDAIILIEQ